MSDKIQLEEYLTIGIVQTKVNCELAWEKPSATLNMKRIVEENVWYEIKKGFCNLYKGYEKPQIIVLPELTVPHGYENDLKNLSRAVGAVVIAGLDYEEIKNRLVRNKAIVVIPNDWPDAQSSRMVSSIYFGKTFFSEIEEKFFSAFEKPYKKLPAPVNYILDAGKFGKIGVAICSDFFDIERFLIYRGRIHHIIVISYNKDLNSYYFLAEAISRLVYCNVVICNTGYYGNSLAFVPYRESHQRIVYRHEGQRLFTTQVVKLPVLFLDKAQRGEEESKKMFKAPPPGYDKLD